MEIKDYMGKMHNIDGCLGCYLSNGDVHELLYKDEDFNVSQDFELPINGFIIISTNNHIVSINELTKEQRYKLIELENRVIELLKSYDISNRFRIILEEKGHFHIWLMPEYEWMKKNGKVIFNLEDIFNYAKNNLRTEYNLKKINDTCKKLKRDLNR